MKANGDFLKTSRMSNPINTYDTPDMFAMLFPTLFPYGVGHFEDSTRTMQPDMRKLDLADHTKFMLSHHPRFQTHTSLPFVVHNMLLIRRSSYKARLTVTRAWWSRAVAALRDVDAASIRLVAEKMTIKRAKNDFTRFEPENEKEERIMELMAYVNFVDDHIPGSTGEVKQMREEIRAVSRSHGTPSLFFTLNPADIKNPLAAFESKPALCALGVCITRDSTSSVPTSERPPVPWLA